MRRWKDPKAEALRKLGMLASATRDELARLTRLLDELTFEPGEVLPDVLPGSGSTYIVLDGLVEMSIDGQPVWTSTAGNLIGDLGLLQDRPRMVARAITQVRVLEFAPGAQRSLCSMPALAQWVRAELVDVAPRFAQPRLA